MSVPISPGVPQPEPEPEPPSASPVTPASPVYAHPSYFYAPPPVPQIVTKPGGLSGAAHAVHILICFFTCGLWLIPYLIIVATQPAQRYEVIVPVGADPAAVQAAYAQANQARAALARPAQAGSAASLAQIAIGVGVFVVILLAAIWFVGSLN